MDEEYFDILVLSFKRVCINFFNDVFEFFKKSLRRVLRILDNYGLKLGGEEGQVIILYDIYFFFEEDVFFDVDDFFEYDYDLSIEDFDFFIVVI